MASEFDLYAAKGNEMLNRLQDSLGVPGDKAFRIMRAVLHAIRSHLDIGESLHVLSQLPMAVKAVYVDQWHEAKEMHRIHHVKQFLDEVRQYDHELAGFDFGNDKSTREIVSRVFKVLSEYISEGEFEDLAAMLPAELKDFVRESVSHELKEAR